MERISKETLLEQYGDKLPSDIYGWLKSQSSLQDAYECIANIGWICWGLDAVRFGYDNRSPIYVDMALVMMNVFAQSGIVEAAAIRDGGTMAISAERQKRIDNLGEGQLALTINKYEKAVEHWKALQAHTAERPAISLNRLYGFLVESSEHYGNAVMTITDAWKEMMPLDVIFASI